MSEEKFKELFHEMKDDLMAAQRETQFALSCVDRTITSLAAFEVEMGKSPEDVLADEVEAKLNEPPRAPYYRQPTKREITMAKKREAVREAQFRNKWDDAVAEAARRQQDPDSDEES